MKPLRKAVPGYEGKYEASNFGEIRTLNYIGSGKTVILKCRINHKGYLIVKLSNNGKHNSISIHRLVASTFIQNDNPLLQVNHKDGNKFNNCVDNLEWVTPRENMLHSYEYLGRKTNSEFMKLHNPQQGKTGALCKNSKKVYQFDLDGNLIKEWGSASEAQRETGISHISCCCLGKQKYAGNYIWKYTHSITS